MERRFIRLRRYSIEIAINFVHILCTSNLLTASVVDDAFSEILRSVVLHGGTALLLIATFLRPTLNKESMMFVCY